MCGISGFVSLNHKSIDKTVFEEMTDVLVHRGPDDRGTYYIDNIALGHRRLSILDLSAGGHQPMHYMERYSIVFNGEIYNYIELKQELSQSGYTFKSKSDTEVIMAAYDKWGIECLDRFNGMWAFAIYDRHRKNLFCARDRFGVKPFYYYKDNDCFIFASEIKAILKYSCISRKANLPRLMESILYYSFDHTNETMFEGIYQIKPGHYLLLNEKQIDEVQWYNLFNVKKNNRKYEENVQTFRDIFIDAVKIRMRSDVPVGSCLSGGLDSSAIVCVTAKLLKESNINGRHETVSSCYDNPEEAFYDEQEYINEVVNATNVTSHKVYPMLDDFFDNLDKIIYHQDEPVGGIAHASQHNVFLGASQRGLTVMLDGQGADEQLGGYTQFYSVIIRENLKKFKLISALREFFYYIKLRNKTELYGTKGLIWFAIKDLLPPAFRRLLLKIATSREECSWFKIPYSSKVIEEIRQYKDFDDYSKKSMKYGLVNLLHYEDRNSMAYSIEGRLPFLDFRLVEHVLSLPPEHRLKNGITKRVLRDSMDGILPDKIKNRMSKLGFAVPIDLWIINHPEIVRRELEKSLLYLEPIIDGKKVLSWFDGNRDNKLALINTTLWQIISAGRWVKIFNVSLT